MLYFIEEMLCSSLGEQIVVELALDFLSVLCYTCLFIFSFFCAFYVSYELDFLCLLFEGYLKFLNFKVMSHHLEYLSICLI